jgi:hypothetical protein
MKSLYIEKITFFIALYVKAKLLSLALKFQFLCLCELCGKKKILLKYFEYTI